MLTIIDRFPPSHKLHGMRRKQSCYCIRNHDIKIGLTREIGPTAFIFHGLTTEILAKKNELDEKRLK